MKRVLRKALTVALIAPMFVGVGVAVDPATSSEVSQAQAVTYRNVYASTRIRATEICLYVMGGKTLSPWAYRDSFGRIYYKCEM